MAIKRLKSNRHKKLKAVDPFYSGDRKLLLDKLVAFKLLKHKEILFLKM